MNKLEKFKELFPESISDEKIDIGVLKQILGEHLKPEPEKFEFTWVGKKESLKSAETATDAILEPCPEESVDWDTTQNIFIEGDNLDALKILQKDYFGKVKMIYIDPPYNTGKKFVYGDKFQDSVKVYKRKRGIPDKRGYKLSNSEESDRRHSNWLNMMLPRLHLARNLLSEDGVVFLSIDDSEKANLKRLCDEIFGEENALGTFIINTTPNGRDYGHIAKNHEYALFYCKNSEACETTLLPDETKSFKYTDKISGFNIHPLYNSNEAFHRENRPNLYYPFYIHTDCPIEEFGEGFFEISLTKTGNSIEVFPPLSQKNSVQFVWRWGKDKSSENLNKEIIGYKTSSGEYRIVQKMRTDEKLIRSIITGKEYTSRRGTAEVESLLNGKFFSFPKPTGLLKQFCSVGMKENSLMLDMFAGSSSSADSVIQLNSKDNGTRRFIMIQLPESIENVDKFKTIADIGKERIRRAAAKIKEENPDYNGDLGFKVFKIKIKS